MPFPGPAPGRGPRPRWPLLAAWAVSIASLLAVALLPRSAAHIYGAVLLGCSAGSLIVVLASAWRSQAASWRARALSRRRSGRGV
jgi:hypothetical protein